MFPTLMKLWNNEDGATAIEYGLIAALIAASRLPSFSSNGSACPRFSFPASATTRPSSER